MPFNFENRPVRSRVIKGGPKQPPATNRGSQEPATNRVKSVSNGIRPKAASLNFLPLTYDGEVVKLT